MYNRFKHLLNKTILIAITLVIKPIVKLCLLSPVTIAKNGLIREVEIEEKWEYKNKYNRCYTNIQIETNIGSKIQSHKIWT